jgi:predicted dehydrogenase
MWMLNFPDLRHVTAKLLAAGKPLHDRSSEVEDFAAAQIEFANNITAQLACSWNLNAGCEAVIQASFYGTKGGASLRNINGSFYDFTAERFSGTQRWMSGRHGWVKFVISTRPLSR